MPAEGLTGCGRLIFFVSRLSLFCVLLSLLLRGSRWACTFAVQSGGMISNINVRRLRLFAPAYWFALLSVCCFEIVF